MLTPLLRNEAVPFETLHERYGSLLALVRTLIGVVPNCDPYLEIWPPAFRTYNVMVPNFLNLPLGIWGLSAPRDIVGLAMYVSSRTASCAYCSAHCCSFAMRRGASADKVAAALENDDACYTPQERAAMAVARSLSRVPADITERERGALLRCFSPADAEWIVLSVCMMGFLNKFMDAIGVELEESTIDEVNGVIASSGWSAGKHASEYVAQNGTPARADSLWTKLRVVRFAPNALALDRKWTAGVPDRWPEVGEWLRRRVGHDFPVLAQVRHRRTIRALATMLRDNFDRPSSVIGLPAKLAAGLVYAQTVENERLADDFRRLGAREGEAHALAHAIAPSPAQVDASAVEAARDLPPAAIVELVTFVSVMQLLHRLMAFYS